MTTPDFPITPPVTPLPAPQQVQAAVDAATGPGDDGPFTYASPHGTITVPSISNIPVGLIRRVRKMSEQDQVFEFLESMADAAALAVVDQMTAQQFGAFMEAWQAHSGASVGESLAS